MRALPAVLRGTGLALLYATAAAGATPAATAPERIEARSATLLAVGIVQGDELSVHLSRLLDNAPVRDAVLTVLLRGVVHPSIAEADGSYTVKTPDLKLPGAAAVTFEVTENGAHDSLKGSLANAAAEGKTEDKNSTRQLAWWVLNFAVCIGFLMLVSRRRKAAKAEESL